MKPLASVFGVVAALAIVGTANGQEGQKRTIKQLTMFFIDAKTKGVSEQTETTGTGIERFEIPEGTVAKKVLLAAKDTSGKEVVVKSVTGSRGGASNLW